MLKNIILLLFTCFVLIGLIEAALQILNYPYYESEVRVGWKYQGSHKNELNQLGFRGQKIEYDSTDEVVLLLGDSQVEDDGCAFDSMPEKYLQKQLQKINPKYKVFSVGAGGYGTDQELLELQSYFKRFRADLVLVWITPSNDVWNNLFPTHIPKDGTPKPTFWLENNQLRGYQFKPDSLIVKNSPFKLVHLLQRIFANPLKGIDENWAKKTMPLAYIPQTIFGGQFLDWTGHRTENLVNEKAHVAMQFLPVSPRTAYGIELTKALFERLKQTAATNKSQIKFFYRDEYPELPTDSSVSVIKQNKGFYTLSKKQYNDNIKALTEPVKSIHLPVLLKDWRVSPEDGHLNPKANERVMQSLVDSLQKNQ